MFVATGVGVSAVAAAAISTLLAGELGSSAYGSYALAVTTVSVIAILTGLGFGPILIRELGRHGQAPRDAQAVPTALNMVATVLVVSVLAAALLATPLGFSLLDSFMDIDRQTAGLMALLLLGMSANVIQAEAFRGLKRFGLAALGGPTLSRLLTVGTIALLAMAPSLGLTSRVALAATAAASVTAAVISGIALARVITPSWTDLARVRPQPRLIPAGLPILSVGLLAFVLVRLPIWVLGLESGTADVGVYAFALSVATLVGMVTPVINGTFSPFASDLLEKDDLAQLQRRARQAANLGGAAVVVAAVPVLVLEHVIVANFLGSDYEAATITTLILLVGVVARTASGPSALILNLSGNQIWGMVGSACGLVIGAAIIYPATVAWGITGAAIAVTTAQVAQQSALAILVVRRVGVRTYVGFRQQT